MRVELGELGVEVGVLPRSGLLVDGGYRSRSGGIGGGGGREGRRGVWSGGNVMVMSHGLSGRRGHSVLELTRGKVKFKTPGR